MVERSQNLANKAKALVKKAKNSASSKVRAAADLNADGKVDAEDAGIAAAWTKQKAIALGKGASSVAKSALRTELGKDAATGAGVGAVAAIPVPVVGPVAGAAVGAGVGVYKHLKKKRSSSKQSKALRVAE